MCQGSSLDLASADATARQIYSLSLDVHGRPLCQEIGANQAQSFRHIQAADSLASMDNVLFTNNSSVGWFAVAEESRARTDLRFLNYAIDHVPFTAQTVIAASYGLHQVMYQTAVGMGYKDSSGAGLSPGDLFQPNISLDLGTEFLAREFRDSSGSQQSDYADRKSFDFQFGPALRGFNATVDFKVPDGENACLDGPITAQFAYACNILSSFHSFDPLPLPGGTSQ